MTPKRLEFARAEEARLYRDLLSNTENQTDRLSTAIHGVLTEIKKDLSNDAVRDIGVSQVAQSTIDPSLSTDPNSDQVPFTQEATTFELSPMNAPHTNGGCNIDNGPNSSIQIPYSSSCARRLSILNTVRLLSPTNSCNNFQGACLLLFCNVH